MSSASNPAFSVDNASFGYGQTVISKELSVEIPAGQFTVIVGPNACGKSTLLRALARLITVSEGEIQCDGTSLKGWKSRRFARHVGFLPQSAIAPDGIRVIDLVRRGRTPYQGLFAQFSSDDEAAVVAALETAGITELAPRLVRELSGGQRQRVWCAMVLAQEPEILLLDEPTTYLDISHQYAVLQMARQLRDEGRTIIVVLHDINQACRYADNIVVMKDGQIEASGSPEAVINEPLIYDVYGLECAVHTDPESQTPMVVPGPEWSARGYVVTPPEKLRDLENSSAFRS